MSTMTMTLCDGVDYSRTPVGLMDLLSVGYRETSRTLATARAVKCSYCRRSYTSTPRDCEGCGASDWLAA